MSARIPISRAMVADAGRMAGEMYNRFGGQEGPYRNENKLEDHCIGKIGELACAQWAEHLGIPCDPAFRYINRKAEADLILDRGPMVRLHIEVKSWSSIPGSWHRLGRCVSVEQMRRVMRRSDIVMWCVVTPWQGLVARWHSGPEVCGRAVIKGWNTPDEVAQITPTLTGWPGQERGLNHQVPMAEVRPLDQLIGMLLGEA